jgi:cyclopropane-fatty-acyl-phospholipid synthase
MLDYIIAKGLLPDFIIRFFIRKLLKKRLKTEYGNGIEFVDKKREDLLLDLYNSPIAINTDSANDQHYMLPTSFFTKCLGERLKYSCCFWQAADGLNKAEEEMLKLTVKRAGLKDGDHILELGHGWGAITLYMAEQFPNSQITAVSNSSSQGEYILQKAKDKNINNIEILTADILELEIDEKFDRIISVEMFEHVRNYSLLLSKINNWLKTNGTLFVHMFTHKELMYKYQVEDRTDWMSKYFFTGGIMPSEHILYYFQDHMIVKRHWRISGTHYGKTLNAWLKLMDQNKLNIMEIFKYHYGEKKATKWFNFWRVFFMSCEELFCYKSGNEWFVTHYLLTKKSD